MTISSTKPILIIGAGPVGLSLAAALAQHHIPCQLFEADPELNQEIRASTLHPPTLEMFAEWGIVNEVLAQGERVRRLMYWERRSRELIAQFDYDLIAGDTPFPFRLQCPQHIVTRVLKPFVVQTGFVTVHMGHRLTHFGQDENGVTATFQTAEGEKVVQGAFLCGADGARSVVRPQLGLTFSGMTYEDRFLLIGTQLDLRPHFPAIGPVNYLFDPDEWVIVLHLPDIVRVVFRLRPHEDEAVATSDAALRGRMTGFLGHDIPFTIQTTQVYRVHQRVAETFRVGRVLLLGDAAHINNPSGGMGMNSGIHDAYWLAAAFQQVVTGQSDTALDEYSQMRRDEARAQVQAYSDKNYRDMTARDATQRQQRDAELRATASDPARARAYLLTASMLSQRI